MIRAHLLRGSGFEFNAVVGVTILIGERTAAQSDADKEGEGPEIEVLHDG